MLHSPPDFRSKQLSFGVTAWFNTNSHLCVSLTGRNSGNDLPHPPGPFTSLTLTKGSPPHLVTPPLVLLFADSSIRLASLLPMQPSAALLLPSQRIPVCQLCSAKGPTDLPAGHPEWPPGSWVPGELSALQAAQEPAHSRGCPELMGWEGHGAREPNPGTCS